MTSHSVAILVYENVSLFELSCAVELFALPRPEFADWYHCDIVSLTGQIVTTTACLQLTARTVSSLDDYNTIIIPSWSTNNQDIPALLASELHKCHTAGKRIISFCSGAFLLAQLGFLDGRKATTHWRYAELFKQRFPQIHYLDDVLYIYDGRLGCSAGSAAAIDLGIEVIRQDFGYAIANQVARRLVISAHRKGGQSQFVETPLLQTPNQFSQALDWALSHLASAINIDTLAQKANMSRRTFDRKFKSTFNLTPHAWLTLQRLELAKQLLETESYSVEKIAALAGFENAITLRHHFRKVLGVSPKQHREQFRDGHHQH